MTQTRVAVEFFTISPGFSSAPIPPGGTQEVTVECVADREGRSDTTLLIEITDADPKTHPNGIPYKLVAEGCIPAVNAADMREVTDY